MSVTTSGSTSITLSSGSFLKTEIVSNALKLSTITGTSYFEDQGTAVFLGIDTTNFSSGSFKVVPTATLNSGTIKIYTATSTDQISYSSYQQTLSDGTVQSPFGRYLNVKLELVGARTNHSVTANTFLSGESIQFDNTAFLFDGSAYVSKTRTLTATQDTSYTDTGSLYRVTLDKSSFKSFTTFDVV